MLEQVEAGELVYDLKMNVLQAINISFKVGMKLLLILFKTVGIM